MEEFKKYLPWIIGAAIVLFILSRLSKGSGATFVPQTQIVQTPQPDPYAQQRADVFSKIIDFAGIESATNAATEQAKQALAVQSQSNILGAITQSKALDVQSGIAANQYNAALASTNAYANALSQQLNLNFLQRQQDIQAQNAAINQYYSSRQNASIAGSISNALARIFQPQGGNVYGTPPIFGFGSGNFDTGGFGGGISFGF